VWVVACGLAWVSGAGADVWVSNARGNNLVQLDNEGAVVRSLAVCQRPRHMVFSPDRKTLLVACSDANQIARVDVQTWTLADTLATRPGPDGLALSPDGATAYVSVQDDSYWGLHACAIARDGTAVCWGNNEVGQSSVPFPSPWLAMSAGYGFSCGVAALSRPKPLAANLSVIKPIAGWLRGTSGIRRANSGPSSRARLR
jgi:DNA-binding beta-propeller fold protein YncE